MKAALLPQSRTRHRIAIASTTLAMLATFACSSNNPNPTSGGANARQPAHTGRYLPISVGATWVWLTTDPVTGASAQTQSVVEARDSLTGTKAGIPLYRVRSTTLTGGTVNWQQDTGTAVVRHREQFTDATGAIVSDYLYDPSKLRLDEDPAHLAPGAAWTETYSDSLTRAVFSAPHTTPVSADWTVVAVDESVTVAAGTFTCLHVHRVEASSGYDSHFWFARNIGKVKESGTELHELVGYSIP
jgi:hypothetical protein